MGRRRMKRKRALRHKHGGKRDGARDEVVLDATTEKDRVVKYRRSVTSGAAGSAEEKRRKRVSPRPDAKRWV